MPAVGYLLAAACSGTQPVDCHQDVVLTTAQDLATYGRSASLDGHLTIEATSLVGIELPVLTRIGGSFRIPSNQARLRTW
jgi:hypothetical protein